MEKMGILMATKKILWVVLSMLQNGWSPLMTASERGHHEIAKVLIEQGANINSQNEVSMTVDEIITSMR